MQENGCHYTSLRRDRKYTRDLGKIVGYEIFVNKVLYTYKFINAYNLIIEVGY